VADIKISQLDNLSSVDSTDVFVVNDVSSGITKQTTLTSILDVVSARNLHDSGANVVVDGDLKVDNEIIVGGDVTLETGTLTFGSLKDATENITVTKFVDEADGILANDNDTTIPTTAAVRDYVDVYGGGGGGSSAAGVLIVDSARGATTLYPVMTGVLSGSDSALVDSALSFNAITNTLTLKGDFVPAIDSAYDLGSPSLKWKDLYLSGTTLNLGDRQLKESDGGLVIVASEVKATAFVGDGSRLTGVATGDTPRTVKLVPDTSQVIRYDSDGITETDTLTFSSVTENFTGTQTYTYSVDGTPIVSDTSSASFTLPDGNEPAYDANILIKVDAKEDGVTKASDYVTVYGIKAGADGIDAVTVFLTNEVHAEAADSAGVLTGDLTDAGGTMKVFVGATDVTGDVALTYSKSDADDKNVAGVTAQIASTGVYDILDFVDAAANPDPSVTKGTVDFSVTVPASLIPSSSSGLTLSKKYSIVKQLGGSGKDGVDGNPGGDGINSRAVKLVPTNGQVVRYDAESGNENDTLTFVAEPENGENTLTYKWSIKDANAGVGSYVDLQNGPSLNFTLPDNQEPAVEGVRTLRCEMYENTDGTDSVEVAQDVVSLFGLVNGSGLTGFLTNATHVEPADSAGKLTTPLTNAGGDFKVFVGTTDVSTGAGVTYSRLSETNITSNINSSGVYSVTDFDLAQDNGSATFRATIPAAVIPGSGTDAIIDQVYSIAKSRAGLRGPAGGGTGSNGEDARTVKLIPVNGQVIRYADDGTTETDTLQFSTFIEGFTGATTYQFSLDKQDGNGFVSKQGGVTSTASTFELADADEPGVAEQYTVEVIVYEGGEVKAKDYVTIYGLIDGIGITAFLTNETHTEPFDNEGNQIGNYDDAGGTFKVYRGVTEITNKCTFGVVGTPSNVTVGFSSNAGATGRGVYSISALAADKGSATLEASIPSTELPGQSAPLNIQKVYSIAKSNQGSNGVGNDAVTADLTNDNHTVTATNAGAVQTPKVSSAIGGSNFYTGATTTFTVREGATDITDSGTVTRTKTPNTADFQYNISSDGRTIEVYNMADGVDEGTVTFSWSKTGYDTIGATFTITKQKAGENGDPAVAYSVQLASFVIGSDGADTETFTPATFTATQRKQTGSNLPVDTTDGTLRLYRNGSGTAAVTETGSTLSYVVPQDTTQVRVELTVGSTVVDDETIPVVNSAIAPGRPPGTWYIDVDAVNYSIVGSSTPTGSLPASNTDAERAWVAGTFSDGNQNLNNSGVAGDEVAGDQAWFYKGTQANPTSQSVWIYSGSAWIPQDKVIDGSLLVTGTVTADKFATTAGADGQTIVRSDVIHIYSISGQTRTLRVALGDLTVGALDANGNEI
jgi:hypothetical protein